MTEERSIATKATGESFRGIAEMAAGAALFAVAVVPILAKFLPIPPVWLLVVAGVAVALLFGKKSAIVKNMAQGAALYGILLWAVPALTGLVGGFLPGAASGDSNTHPLLTA